MSEVNKDNAIHLKVGGDVLYEQKIKLCDIDHITTGHDRLCNEITYVTIYTKFSGSYGISINSHPSFLRFTDEAYRAKERMDIHIENGKCKLVCPNLLNKENEDVK